VNLWLLLAVLGTTALASGLLTAWLIPRLQGAQVVDIPNARSLHVRPVPRGGGLAIAAVVIVTQCALLVGQGWHLQTGLVTTLVAGGFAGLGWADDRAGRGVVLRLLVQAVLAVLFVTLAVPAELSVLQRAGLCLALLWGVNLFNFMDGSDGLAAVQAMAASIGLGVLLSVSMQSGAALAAFGLAGATAGFLRWNWHPARIFLGDVGSYFIGFELTALVILSAQSMHTPWPAVILVAPFVTDATLTLLVRLLRGMPVWRAHREHVYQRLVLRGCSPARVACVLAALLVGLCWPSAAWSVVAGVLPAVFVYGLLAIIWLWLRGRAA
jgi:Fuc2NAc and GlcNAc transferase